MAAKSDSSCDNSDETFEMFSGHSKELDSKGTQMAFNCFFFVVSFFGGKPEGVCKKGLRL